MADIMLFFRYSKNTCIISSYSLMRSTLTIAFSKAAAYLANRKTSCITVMADVRLNPAKLAPIKKF